MRLSYTKIAVETGLSISHVSRVMRRQRTPSLRVLILLSKAMKMPVDRLIRKLKMKGVNRWGR